MSQTWLTTALHLAVGHTRKIQVQAMLNLLATTLTDEPTHDDHEANRTRVRGLYPGPRSSRKLQAPFARF